MYRCAFNEIPTTVHLEKYLNNGVAKLLYMFILYYDNIWNM